jgi:hypothetical protein
MSGQKKLLAKMNRVKKPEPISKFNAGTPGTTPSFAGEASFLLFHRWSGCKQ